MPFGSRAVAGQCKHYSFAPSKPTQTGLGEHRLGKRYILFHDKRHAQQMGVSEIEVFLTHLTVEQRVAAQTA